MTLVIIVVCLLIDRLSSELIGLRNFRWYEALTTILHEHLDAYAFWNGPIGVLICLTIPVGAVALLAHWFYQAGVVYFLFSIVVLLFSLGPRNLWELIERYLDAMRTGDLDTARAMVGEILTDEAPGNEDPPGTMLVEAILLEANRRTFAILLWFFVLGPAGAVLARLAYELRHAGQRYAPNQRRGFRDSVNDLEAIVNFIPARLTALGYALSGSLLHAFEDWQFSEIWGLYDNDVLLKEAGLGALLLGRAEPADTTSGERLQRIELARGLIWRTLCVFLTVLAIMTIAGWSG
jgi:AmpE protein